MQRIAQGHRLRAGRVSESNRVYLITAVCHKRQAIFSSFENGRAFVHAIRDVEQAITLCYVVMPDHIHWLLQLAEDADLSQAVQKAKSLTTMALRKSWSGPIWQRGFHDHALRKEEDIQAFARYVVANPLRAGLVKSLRYYSLWDAIWL
ncbi:REP-associated tyrosine transposase [Microbulbifer harenosus]|uniref:Transposase n=1 Tax=Microbulbifer harenosus TaxID=2576840 RepID=A0ABY2UMU0_9GAMM|nr:transposase [Microbulbifer harenosus]TLM79894.1 transposase [Microbulbifer harenosus]